MILTKVNIVHPTPKINNAPNNPTEPRMTSQQALIKFGFKFGQSGPHGARSMMLADLERLFSVAPLGTTREAYKCLIFEQNVLDKPTSRSRDLTYHHLVDLYGMSEDIPLFRTFRRLWQEEPAAHPVLALQFALVRDALLRRSIKLILETPIGAVVTREQTEELLKKPDPDRFSAASLKSFAQNINGSWTQAGYLKGKVKKVRVRPALYPTNVVFGMFLAYLEGATGERLLTSKWCGLLGLPEYELVHYATMASQRGMIDFKCSGGVTDVRFSEFLRPDEERWLSE